MSVRAVWLIAKSVLIEAVRRREVYVIVLFACLLIGAAMTVDFFEIEGLTKFYREVALKVMSVATALAVVVLSARQLPREFSNRTIYPLLARPIGRGTFLAGKVCGVMLAAAFCFGLFMAVYVGGSVYLGGDVPWALFAQYIYLQMLMMLVLATLCFWLSLMLNLDAAITIGVLLYVLAATYMSVTTFLYEFVSSAGQALLVLMTWAIPQLPLFDLSEKAVHAEVWPPIGLGTMAQVTVYGLVFASVYYGLALLWFRGRAL